MFNFVSNIDNKIIKTLNQVKLRIDLQKLLVAGIILLSLFATIRFESKIAAVGIIFILLAIPVVLSDIKTFLIILIVFKMLINGLYNVYIFGNINILQMIGAFMPLFLIAYILIKKINFREYPIYKLMLIFLAEVILSSIITIYGTHNPITEIEKILRLLNGLSCYFAIPFIFKTKEDIVLFLKAWVISVSFPLLIGLYQIITGQFHFQVSIVGETELHRAAAIYHDVGTIIFAGLIFTLIILFYNKGFENRTKKLLFYILLGLSSFIIYRTYSKAAAIMLAVVLILYAIYYRRKLILIFSAVIVVIIFFSESSGVYKRVEYDILAREKWGDRLMLSGRVGIWQRNLDRYISYTPLHKFIGHETFGAHNDYLRVLLDYGFVGLILYVAILVYVLLKLLSLLKYITIQFYKKLIFIAFLSQICFIINCFATNPSLYTDYQWFHWGLIGLAFVNANRKNIKMDQATRNQ